MRPIQKLNELIASYMSVPGHVQESGPETDFVISGLRAASSANLIMRKKILSDVSEVLSCKSEDLEFLFTDFGTPSSSVVSYEVMVPDFQSRLFAIAE